MVIADNQSQPISGLILAAGLSTRMGTDKGLLVYHGKPQREFLFDLLKDYCATVFTSCREDQHVSARFNPLFDSAGLVGPLNGILTAFRMRRSSPWLVVAVDMPFVDASVIEILIREREKGKLATCFYNASTEQPEPLLTLWESEAYPLLEKFVEAGGISPRKFLSTHPVRMITPPDERILFNVNHPGQFES